LDLAALEASFWKQLTSTDPDNAEGPQRRAYVVLRYEACLSDEVPVIPLPCSDDHDGLAASRLRDSFRLCLEAEAPPDPYATVRDITRRPLPAEPRQRLLRHALNDAPMPGSLAPLERFWSADDDAALLLATLDLEANGAASGEGSRLLQPVRLRPPSTPAGNPNNDVRAVLPAVQALADLALGIRLEGPSSAAAPFQVLGVTATAIDGAGVPISTGGTAEAMVIEIQLSERVLVNPDPAATTSALQQAVQLLVWDPVTSTWLEVTESSSSSVLFEWSVSSATEPAAIRLKAEPAWTAPSTIFQVVLKGSGPAALISNTLSPRPLAGVAGEIVPPGTGRDAYLFGTYTPPTP
jgi:hypothetical protein